MNRPIIIVKQQISFKINFNFEIYIADRKAITFI